jgi:hypothetical protein
MLDSHRSFPNYVLFDRFESAFSTFNDAVSSLTKAVFQGVTQGTHGHLNKKIKSQALEIFKNIVNQGRIGFIRGESADKGSHCSPKVVFSIGEGFEKVERKL